MTLGTNPALSVLLITYNHEKFIAHALESVLMQFTDFDFEIVMADDCSSDSTLSVVKGYEEQDARLRVLPAEAKLGISRNYQRGFAACRGQYIAVLEGDDYWISPRKLQATSAFLKRNPNCSFCFHRTIRYDQHPEAVAVYPPNWTAEQMLTAGELARGNFIGGLSTCVYRREIIDSLKTQLWELDIREWFFNIVVAENGPIGYVPQIFSVYRAHPEGISSMQPPGKTVPEILKLIDVYDEFLDHRLSKEFQAFRQTLVPGMPKTPSTWRRIWFSYWLLRIWIAARLPPRVKRVLRKFVP